MRVDAQSSRRHWFATGFTRHQNDWHRETGSTFIAAMRITMPETMRRYFAQGVINRSAPWLNFRAESVIGALATMRQWC
jgi:hypothetical protein